MFEHRVDRSEFESHSQSQLSIMENIVIKPLHSGREFPSPQIENLSSSTSYVVNSVPAAALESQSV